LGKKERKKESKKFLRKIRKKKEKKFLSLKLISQTLEPKLTFILQKTPLPFI
jgi:hypothetical protein